MLCSGGSKFRVVVEKGDRASIITSYDYLHRY